MPGLTQAIEVYVEFNHHLAAELRSAIEQYAGLKQQSDLLDQLMYEEKERIQAVLNEAGVDKASANGFHVAIVRGTTSKLDPKKLQAMGVTPAQLEMATTVKPKAPYLSVRKASEGKQDEDAG